MQTLRFRIVYWDLRVLASEIFIRYIFLSFAYSQKQDWKSVLFNTEPICKKIQISKF